MVGAALAPDLDLLFQFVDGRNHHSAETHGIGFALLPRYLIEAESISVVSDQMRTVVETEWPALAHKLPPKDSPS